MFLCKGIMRKLILPLFCLFLVFSLSGCGLMEDAFKAGRFFGIIVIAIIALLVWLLRITIKLLIRKGILQIEG
jgi:hypothetical protein